MVSAWEQVQSEQPSFSLLESLFTARDDSGRLGHDASTESTAGFTGWHTPSSRRVCCCSGLYGFGQDEIGITEPVGGANGDEPFSSVSIATSVAAHPRRSPLTFAMRRVFPILAAFLVGGVVASVPWGIYALHRQIEFVGNAAATLDGQAHAGEQILGYLDEPEPQKAARLAFMASNMVACFPSGIDMCEEQYPFFHVKRSWSSDYNRYQQFLRERHERWRGGEPAGAANGSQPIRSETNSTSSTAGSRR